jgi:hypothetical protein
MIAVVRFLQSSRDFMVEIGADLDRDEETLLRAAPSAAGSMGRGMS